ncbi:MULTISPECIES: type II toxin-antitoxin system YafQ family toxin [Blautia]|jgi:mRNA interferase YafQ|uniref:Type II toxin-antitoxin system YafQ family toxin n=1 Tax=Blautia faecicola TaxID=2509240 RepID=A0A4Q1RL11_9FIRM|nr:MULTISPECIES: type II toxin-antitoxin system YafQ family toxin [Blautia]MBC5756446.1 type II toxin-antitoxin system YafQ family toxin [Blautia tarda]MCC2237659.1 type II toxin-antitoxin system YafQ family toxin [Fusicatenibacter sp. CLA-AA-H213]RGF14098.1 type II toxin-antitoxin system YafQ family toxin [Blautia sp. AM16-16B]RHO01316.1 type II toxin-antitoxin system YafQ family toxin [Blautia sp. AM22-22LB]RHQ58355.1 type II toxin-antitoxin system YafQ family toxin [Blautia sp. AF25-12LB]R
MTRYEIKNTTQFKKDYKLARRRGLNMDLLKDVVTRLANGEPLDPRHKDHPLSGEWSGHRECHIQPDWLLIYRYENDILVLALTRTGTHSDLFNL